MTLIHDPSAIRYASTQEAYGTTWTLDSIDSDGAQTWKNAKGHTALVQKAVEQVRQSQTISSAGNIYSLDRIAKRYSDDSAKKTIKFHGLLPIDLVADYSKSDCELTQSLMEKGFFVDWHTEPNESNKPKVITNVALSDNGKMTDGYYYDRCLTNEEIASIWKNGHASVPGGKKMF